MHFEKKKGGGGIMHFEITYNNLQIHNIMFSGLCCVEFTKRESITSELYNFSEVPNQTKSNYWDKNLSAKSLNWR